MTTVDQQNNADAIRDAAAQRQAVLKWTPRVLVTALAATGLHVANSIDIPKAPESPQPLQRAPDAPSNSHVNSYLEQQRQELLNRQRSPN